MTTILDKYAELLLQGMPLEQAWLKANDGVLLATAVERGPEGYIPADCQPATRKELLKENWERRRKGLSQIAYPGLPVLLREESLTEEQFLKEYLGEGDARSLVTCDKCGRKVPSLNIVGHCEECVNAKWP